MNKISAQHQPADQPGESPDLLTRLLKDSAARLDDAAKNELRAVAKQQRFTRGQQISAIDSTVMHNIITGQLRLFYQRPDGQEQLITILGPGDVFASGLDLSSGRYSRAEAMVASEIGSIEITAATRLTQTHPELGNYLLLNLVRQTRLLAGRVESLLAGESTHKVASVLVDLAIRLGHQRADGGLALVDGITQSDLAAMSGIRRETANKALAEFHAQGLTEINGHTIIVRDLAGLRSVAHAGEHP